MENSSRGFFRRDRTRVTPPPTAAERAAIARSLQRYTHDPEGVVARNSAPAENDDATTETGRPSGASDASPDQARRPLLTTPEVETRPFDDGWTTAGEIRARRFSHLRTLVSNHRTSTASRRRRNEANANEAIESTLSDQGMNPVTRDFSVDETSSPDGPEHTLGTGLFNPANPSNRATALDRLAITSNFATHLSSAATNPSRSPSITASGSPSLILRVSTDDGGTATRVNPRAAAAAATATAAGATSAASGASPARSTSSVGMLSPAAATRVVRGASRARGGPVAGVRAAARAAGPADGSLPNSTGGAQAAGDGPAANNNIPAGGALPAAADVPAVGTMPAIGRVAYVTVQSPDNRFYTVRVDLTDAAPNATYNITINIPPPYELGQRFVIHT